MSESDVQRDVLIVDDEEAICWGLERLLTDAGHRVRAVATAEEAIALAAERRPDLVVLDVRLPGMDGLTAMAELRKVAGDVPIVVITAFGNLDTAVAAMAGGAIDYLTKPFDLEQAATLIEGALLGATRPRTAPVSEAETTGLAHELLGNSPAMQEIFKRIALVARSDVPVVLTGESGTGKELAARAIHRHSLRAAQPFLTVNLASLSAALIESELFGHVRGAFTGADAPRKGLLELADKATVFFDEVADVPPQVQVKLLRVLEQREVTPVGDCRPRPTDFRIITATNRDLRQEVAAGRFRQDLYFRLAGFEIRLPALRERSEDIPVLAEHFLTQARNSQAVGSFLTEETLRELQTRPWPGNVRELRRAIEHAALVARGRPIAPGHLPDVSIGNESQDRASLLRHAVRAWAQTQLAEQDLRVDLYERFLSVAEPALFESVLAFTRRNQASAAVILGIHRQTLRKKLR